MPNSKSRTKNQRNQRTPQERSGPTSFRANLEVKHRYRFTSTAGNLTAITPNKLLCAAGVMATSSTEGHAIFRAVKLDQIEIWTPPASQGQSATCSVYWSSGGPNVGMTREVSDTTVSTAIPAHVRTSPPANSLASFYGAGTTGASPTIASLMAPTGSIIDVWVSLVMADGDFDGAVAVLVAAGTGRVYYCCLDSVTAATGLYKPVSLSVA